jgi:nucleotide-binding universal stress UspA family protein
MARPWCSAPTEDSNKEPQQKGLIQAALQLVDSPAQLHLLHVMEPLETMSPGVITGNVTDEVRTQRVTEALTRLATDHGAGGAQIAVAIGTPGLAIADYAAAHATELILIPSHGYHGVKRLFLGSVAERVLRHAPCNVFVLRRSDAE